MSKIGRNQMCPCGSRKKYKRCCGRVVTEDKAPTLNDLIDLGFDRLSRITVYLIQNLGRVAKLSPGDRRDVDFECMLKKSMYSLCTVGSLRQPHQIEGAVIFDHSSANSLVRTMYEVAVALRYIFCHQEDQESLFWHAVWRINGHKQKLKSFQEHCRADGSLTYAQKYPDHNQTQEDLLAEYTAKLKATPKFSSLDERRQRDALAGAWRKVESTNPGSETPWHDMAEKVGISKYAGKVGYRLGSAYIHSDASSAFQIHDAFEPEKQKEQVYTALMQAIALHGHAMDSYFIRYPGIRDEPSHDKAHRHLQWWLSVLNRDGSPA